MLRVTFYGNRRGASAVGARVPTFSIPALAQAISPWLFTRERRIGAEFDPTSTIGLQIVYLKHVDPLLGERQLHAKAREVQHFRNTINALLSWTAQLA